MRECRSTMGLRGTARHWCLVAALTVVLLAVRPAAAVTFGPGSLIVPMDTTAQNFGMLRAYGLVYALLRSGVPVSWVIEPTKSAGGDDVTIGGGPSGLQDVRTGATVVTPRTYRGGPFVVAAADAAAATPIIAAWQATAGDATTVHRLVSGSFNATVARTLVGAPHIVILKDGNEVIAFNDLNAAGIPDAAGLDWSATSTDLATESDVAGPSAVDHGDGSLRYQPSGLPRYCHLYSQHYNTTASTDEVVNEVRSWLAHGALTHASMECASITAFENATGGLFLTTGGLQDDGTATATPTVRVPNVPLTQIDGAFDADSGAVDSIGLAGGSSFKSGVSTLINESTAALISRIVYVTGRLDGDSGKGRVSYLAGHDYALDLPITSNPQTNGIRLLLNALFESDCATTAIQSDVTLQVSSPPLIDGASITYTIDYENPGPRPAESVRVTASVPPGTSFVSATGGGTHASGTVTWNLPALAASTPGSVSFMVSASSDGSYPSTATMDFSHLTVRHIVSAPSTTIVGPIDADGDGSRSLVDCNDADDTIYPGATEVVADGVDQDCDGHELCFADADEDGYRPSGLATVVSADLDCTDPGEATGLASTGDCDDTHPNIHPGAIEICDAGRVDEDCNGVADDADSGATGTVTAYTDGDGDGYGGGTGTARCHLGSGETTTAGDCNDADASIHPGAAEICTDVVDNDCNAAADCNDVACAVATSCVSPRTLCSTTPRTCKTPGRSRFVLAKRAPKRDDHLVFKWLAGDATTLAELGQPAVDTLYAVCVWDYAGGTPALVMAMLASPDPACDGQSCWRSIRGSAMRYRNKQHGPDGLADIFVKTGSPGKTKVVVDGLGAALPDPPMPFGQEPKITVQVVNSLGTCWSTDYSSAAKVNTASKLVLQERGAGRRR